jgi:Mg-chelatase subunit ChlI
MDHPEGTVTIRLKDYENLRSEQSKALEIERKFVEVSHELEVFLSYLCTRYEVEEHVQKYNMQSTRARILIIDGKAKIEIRNKKNNNE